VQPIAASARVHWPPAPVSQADLDRALRPFGESTMLPAAAYTAPEVLAWERRHLFAGTWTCLGRTEDVFPGGSSQRAALAGDVSVLLTRDGDDIAAFGNTCRHRGHELLPDDGTADKKTIVCPYHAWTFRLDGDLHAAPGFRGVEEFDPAEYGLVRLPAVSWHVLVLVNE
jgi:Rieske 2Fe-2S family protein